MFFDQLSHIHSHYKLVSRLRRLDYHLVKQIQKSYILVVAQCCKALISITCDPYQKIDNNIGHYIYMLSLKVMHFLVMFNFSLC